MVYLKKIQYKFRLQKECNLVSCTRTKWYLFASKKVYSTLQFEQKGFEKG